MVTRHSLLYKLGDIAKRLRQRSAKPSSSVQIRVSPFSKKPKGVQIHGDESNSLYTTGLCLLYAY